MNGLLYFFSRFAGLGVGGWCVYLLRLGVENWSECSTPLLCYTLPLLPDCPPPSFLLSFPSPCLQSIRTLPFPPYQLTNTTASLHVGLCNYLPSQLFSFYCVAARVYEQASQAGGWSGLSGRDDTFMIGDGWGRGRGRCQMGWSRAHASSLRPRLRKPSFSSWWPSIRSLSGLCEVHRVVRSTYLA